MNKIYAFIDNTSDSEKILKEGVNSFSVINLSKIVPGQSGTYINHFCFVML